MLSLRRSFDEKKGMRPHVWIITAILTGLTWSGLAIATFPLSLLQSAGSLSDLEPPTQCDAPAVPANLCKSSKSFREWACAKDPIPTLPYYERMFAKFGKSDPFKKKDDSPPDPLKRQETLEKIISEIVYRDMPKQEGLSSAERALVKWDFIRKAFGEELWDTTARKLQESFTESKGTLLEIVDEISADEPPPRPPRPEPWWKRGRSGLPPLDKGLSPLQQKKDLTVSERLKLGFKHEINVEKAQGFGPTKGPEEKPYYDEQDRKKIAEAKLYMSPKDFEDRSPSEKEEIGDAVLETCGPYLGGDNAVTNTWGGEMLICPGKVVRGNSPFQ